MSWVYLLVAGFLEIVWAILLKYTEGFSKFWPTLITWSIILMSVFFLAQAVKNLPIGTAYAIWTGIGAAGTAIMGIVLFDESKEIFRLLCIIIIIIGIAGLKLTSSN